MFVVAGQGEVDGGGAEEEDEGYEAFGEDGEGEGGPHEVGVGGGGEARSGFLRCATHMGVSSFGRNDRFGIGRRRTVRALARMPTHAVRLHEWGTCTRSCGDAVFEGAEEAVEGGAEEEGEQDFGDEVAGEEEDAGGGEGGEAGVEGGAGAEGSCGPVVAEESEEENGDGLGEVGGEGVEAEDAEAEGDEPVGERRFFEVADAVDAEGDEVAGEGHVAGGAGVGGVGVVEQGRSRRERRRR